MSLIYGAGGGAWVQKDPDYDTVGKMKEGVLQAGSGVRDRACTLLRAVVLNPWVATPVGVEWPFHRGQLDHQKTDVYIKIYNSSKIRVKK